MKTPMKSPFLAAALLVLASLPAAAQLPGGVVMVSADALGERIEHLLRLGAIGYLTKPYKLDEFLRVIQDALTKGPAK